MIKKNEAEKISRQDLEKYLEKYKNSGATVDNVVEWSDTGLPGAASNKTHTYDTENEWNTWTVHAIVEDNDNIKNDKYLPKNVTAYHELMHVEETPKGATSDSEHSPMVEVLPTINTIIQVDKIYKEIHGLDISEEVDYKRKITLGKNQVDIGQLANFYRNLESQYPNMGEAVVSPKSLTFIKGES